MKVLAVASEFYPLVKTGGLADVTGALPGALAGEGVEMRTILPGYPSVMGRLAPSAVVKDYAALLGHRARILQSQFDGCDFYILDCPPFFERIGTPYSDYSGSEWADNWRRFAALSRAAADIGQGELDDWRPDVVHAHDWQAALTLAYMRYGPAPHVPRVITIHNLAFQGRFGPEIFSELGLPSIAWGVDGVEYYGGTGFLKAGLAAAHAITAVSPTYAEEIKTPENGMGLDGLLRAKSDRLVGILNGIDPVNWDPQNDPSIEKNYTFRTLGSRKANRTAIERRFGLDAGSEPLFVVVSRLTWQKGMDLLVDAIDHLVAAGGRLAVLGTGDRPLEGAFLAAAERHRGRVGVQIGYDETLAHLMQAGGDAILIPSRFEPCGLTQLYGLRYGCVPVAAQVGGLADTIIDANDAAVNAKTATGVLHRPDDAPQLHRAIDRTIALHADQAVWTGLQKAGMKADFSWSRSAARYMELYDRLTVTETSRPALREAVD